jgi:hypothetical protein
MQQKTKLHASIKKSTPPPPPPSQNASKKSIFFWKFNFSENKKTPACEFM